MATSYMPSQAQYGGFYGEELYDEYGNEKNKRGGEYYGLGLLRSEYTHTTSIANDEYNASKVNFEEAAVLQKLHAENAAAATAEALQKQARGGTGIVGQNTEQFQSPLLPIIQEQQKQQQQQQQQQQQPPQVQDPIKAGAGNDQEGADYYDYYSETSKNPGAAVVGLKIPKDDGQDPLQGQHAKYQKLPMYQKRNFVSGGPVMMPTQSQQTMMQPTAAVPNDAAKAKLKWADDVQTLKGKTSSKRSKSVTVISGRSKRTDGKSVGTGIIVRKGSGGKLGPQMEDRKSITEKTMLDKDGVIVEESKKTSSSPTMKLIVTEVDVSKKGTGTGTAGASEFNERLKGTAVNTDYRRKTAGNESPNQTAEYLDYDQRRDQLPFNEVDPSTTSFDKASSKLAAYVGAKADRKSQTKNDPSAQSISHESFYSDDNYYESVRSLPCPQYPANDIRNIDPADFPECFEGMKNKPQKRTGSQGSKTTGKSRTSTMQKKLPEPKGCVLGPNFGRPRKESENEDIRRKHYVFCHDHHRLVNKYCGAGCPHCAHVEQYRPYVPDTRPMPLNFFDPPSVCCCVKRTDQFGRYTDEAIQWSLYSD